MRPATIKVGPFTYVVKYDVRMDDLGETLLDDLLINIKKGLVGDVEKETLLHEILHAVNHVYCAKELKENQIRQMSIGLYQVLKDNEIF